MRLLLFGKTNNVARLVEDPAEDLRLAGHEVRVFPYRGSGLTKRLEPLLVSERLGVPLAALLRRAVRRFAPDLVVAFGPFHWLPPAVFAPLAAMRGRPPMVAWIGDRFGAEAAAAAGLFDLVAYTDSGFLALHRSFGFPTESLFLPLAATRGAVAVAHGPRSDCPVFVASATLGRRALLTAVHEPVVLIGPDWRDGEGIEQHARDPRRVDGAGLAGIYASHAAALNIRHERNVIAGLNQRHFAPYVVGTPAIADAQSDLPGCFEPEREIFVYRDAGDLDATIARLRREPERARMVGDAGRRRVLAEHLYANRIAAMARAVGVRAGYPRAANSRRAR